MISRFLTTLILVLGLAQAGWALTLTLEGSIVGVSYEEPSTNKNGTSLTDLAHTTIYYDLGDGPVRGPDVFGASLAGGGSIISSILIPVLEDMEADVDIWITATDTSSNESGESARKTIRIDRLAPAPPQ